MAVLLCACRGFGPPPAEVLALLPAETSVERASERRVALVDLVSPQVTGSFTAIVVVRGGPGLCLRAQLMPEVGGKLLDLVVTPELVRGYFPHAEARIDRSRAEGGALEPGLLAFLAASLAEDATPVVAARVRGVKAHARGHELLLVPALEGVDVTAFVDANGVLLERHYRLGGVGWHERLAPERVFESRGFRWTILEEERQPIPLPDEALFELVLPEDPRP